MNPNPQNVLITGASRGLGKALAIEFANRGARIIGVARETRDLDATVTAIRAAGGEAWAISCDMGLHGAAAELAAKAAALAGPIDVLINNASTLGATPLPLLLDLPPERLERTFAVNVVGHFALTRAVAGSMVLRGGGTIVNISSDAAVESYPHWGGYAASKAALDHLTRSWSTELDGTHVRFLAVDPGEMDTRMHADAIPEADRTQLAQPEAVARRLLSLIESDVPSGERISLPGWKQVA